MADTAIGLERRTGGGRDRPPITVPVHLSIAVIDELVELVDEALNSYVQDGAHRDQLERGRRALHAAQQADATAGLWRDIAGFEGAPPAHHLPDERSLAGLQRAVAGR